MKLLLTLSDGNTALVERDGLGLRIVESSYGFIHPPKTRAYYLDESSLQGGPIHTHEYELDGKGQPTGRGIPSRSGRSIHRYQQITDEDFQQRRHDADHGNPQ